METIEKIMKHCVSSNHCAQCYNSLLLRRFVFRMVSHRGERKTRVTGDEAQGTFPPSFGRKISSRERERERERETSRYTAGAIN